jgi:uncharacterized protein YdhG (YjbR/CyaY superfamily)
MDEKQQPFTTIDEYIASFPEAVQERLNALRQLIREEATDAHETISYGMPTFRLNGNLVYFGAYKQHVAVYPATDDMDAAIEGLAAYRTGKGTFQFPHDQPLPLPLIRRIVAFRVQEQARGK